MSEQKDNEIQESTVCQERSQQKTRKIFVLYIIGLFCVALGLILLSYIMQQHANAQLEALDTQLTEQTDAAKGAKARADQLQEKMDSMQDQLDEAKAESDELTQQVKDQETALQAYDQMIELMQLAETDADAAEKLIDEMDAAYTREALTNPNKQPLTGAAAEEYESICDALEK